MSKCQDSANPPITLNTPSPIAQNAMASGVRERRRAVAAGMINSEPIIKAPTNFIPTAITKPISSIKIKRIRSVLVPSTKANSSFTLVERRGCQRR
ncbi:Uncharacterised protein [Vibrio cholerae]|nr:Uncharacterised protein [Vibrio cholerae]CSB21897.1 Uncharacterised protein [Vibrio cholerae]CSB59688.1 Uncharacterised protein [Vibrio cholerae]CSB89543.1 Uncharacterised protein [Vibrio cholerae]CSD10493.1 Uncharacterised protein [Vibrio cholerae]